MHALRQNYTFIVKNSFCLSFNVRDMLYKVYMTFLMKMAETPLLGPIQKQT
jgi:hypothetical protein